MVKGFFLQVEYLHCCKGKNVFDEEPGSKIKNNSTCPDNLVISVVKSIPTAPFTFSSHPYHPQELYSLFANMSIKRGINGISENTLTKKQNTS